MRFLSILSLFLSFSFYGGNQEIIRKYKDYGEIKLK